VTVATDAPRLWAVVGATGTGKTALSLDLAEALAERGRRAEIVNADAMQLYRGMDIGTAKLPEAERRGIPHHLFDALAVTDEAAVAWYQQAAHDAIAGIHERGADAILVGGSGLYVSSVIYDFRFPPHDEALRAELEAQLATEGPGMLFARLQERDPVTAARIDPKNGRRIVRALEVIALTGRPFRATLPGAGTPRYDAVLLGVDRDVAELDERVALRVDRMLDDGLVDETRALLRHGLAQGRTASRALGYRQVIEALDRDPAHPDLAGVREETVRATRRFVRRQRSWFRRDRRIHWLDGAASDLVASARAVLARRLVA
jgi:tRNA dimethylallyltransferase